MDLVDAFLIRPSYLDLNLSNFKLSSMSIITEFCIGEVVGIRNDEKTKSDIKMYYGQEHAEKKIIGQIGRVLKISTDKTQVQLHLQNGTKRFFDIQFVESLPNYLNESEELSRLQALVVSIMENAMEGIELSPVLEQAFQHFLFDADATIGEHDVTALHVACRNGDVNAVKLLIAHGASLEREDSYGNRAVHNAAMRNHQVVLNLLISKGARLDCANKDKQTPLHLAASGLFPECLDSFLEIIAKVPSYQLPPLDVNFQDREGNTALHLAITKLGQSNGESKFPDLLLKKMILLPGVKFLLRNGRGRTVLQTAAEVGNLWALECLLSSIHGVSLTMNEILDDVYSPRGPTSIYLASKAGHYEVVKYLLEFYLKNHQELRSTYLPAGEFNLDKCSKLRLYRPLVGAIKRDHYGIVELLVASPLIDINASDRNRESAMLMATRRIGCTQKFPDGSAPAIFKIYEKLKLCLPDKAEPALAVILFLMRQGVKLDEREPKTKIFIDTLLHLNVEIGSTNGFRQKSISDLIKACGFTMKHDLFFSNKREPAMDLLQDTTEKSFNVTAQNFYDRKSFENLRHFIDDVVQTSPQAQKISPTNQCQINSVRYKRRKIPVISHSDELDNRCVKKKKVKVF